MAGGGGIRNQVNNVIVQVGNDGSNDEISLDVSAGFIPTIKLA